MHQAALRIKRRHFQHDPVLARAQRPLFGAQSHLQIVGAGRHHVVAEVETVSVSQWLVGLSPNVQLQRVAAWVCCGVAGFDVEMQDEDVAPGVYALQRQTGGRVGLRQLRVDIAFQAARGFGGLEVKGAVQRVGCQWLAQRRMAGEQRRSVLRLRGGGWPQSKPQCAQQSAQQRAQSISAGMSTTASAAI